MLRHCIYTGLEVEGYGFLESNNDIICSKLLDRSTAGHGMQ